MMQYLFNGAALPTNYYAALINSGSPADTTNTKSDVTEVPGSNGYTTGGISLTKNTTDFPGITEDDTNHYSSIRVKNLVWTAATGDMPASGGGATYLLLTDDNATQGSRVVFAYWSLTSPRTVSVGQQLQVNNAEMRFVNT